MGNDLGTRFVSFMLSWLKAVASWVLRLVNLSNGMQPLTWLSKNWLTLLAFLLIIGVVMDFIIWIIRWRPHWEWFGKKRIVVNDATMVAEPEEHVEGLFDDAVNTADRTHYIVPNGAVPHKSAGLPSGKDRKQRIALHQKQRRANRRRITQDPIDDVFEVGDSDPSLLREENGVFNVAHLPRIPVNEHKEDTQL